MKPDTVHLILTMDHRTAARIVSVLERCDLSAHDWCLGAVIASLDDVGAPRLPSSKYFDMLPDESSRFAGMFCTSSMDTDR